jgi:DNA-damage-inducible protein J
MSSSSLVQTRIDPEIKERAAAVLEKVGMTVSDAVRILLTRIANEGNVPPELLRPDPEHDAWFRAKVEEALRDPRPRIPHEEVEARMARRRAEIARRKSA